MSGRSPNASASQFGWDFQYNAGIVMMLKNIKDAKSVRIEGKTEDIELELNDGQKIFGQAKGFVDPSDVHNAKAKLNDLLNNSIRFLNYNIRMHGNKGRVEEVCNRTLAYINDRLNQYMTDGVVKLK